MLLAIETSTSSGSVALWDNGESLYRNCPSEQTHSQTLLPLLQQLLSEADITFGALKGVAFGSGPGAFTGLRIASGMAQGIAVAHDLPVFPICTLAALAWGSGADKVLAMLDARMGEAYVGRYLRANKTLQQDGELLLATPEDIVRMLFSSKNTLSAGWTACGNGLLAFPSLREAARSSGMACNVDDVPHAVAVAELAAQDNNGGLDAALAIPQYLRNKVAKTSAERLAAASKA